MPRPRSCTWTRPYWIEKVPYTPKSPGRWPSVPLAYTASRNTATESSAFPPPAWPAPGPDGDKPAGLVYVGLRIPASLTPDHAEVLKAVELHLDGMREEIRRLTVFHVLQNLSLFTASFKE